MSKDNPKEIGDIWNSVKADDDAEYDLADPDFKAKVGHVASEARQGRSTGIAGLEKFEAAVAKDAGVALTQSGVDAASTPGSPSAVGDKPEESKGSSSRSGKAKALKDAEGAGKKVESDEVNSPSAPSAARPMAAESPANKKSTKRRSKSKK